MIESSAVVLAAFILVAGYALVALLARPPQPGQRLSWLTRCGHPMPPRLRPDKRSVYPCRKRWFHKGHHLHSRRGPAAGTSWQ